MSDPTPVTVADLVARYRVSLGRTARLLPLPEKWLECALKAAGQTRPGSGSAARWWPVQRRSSQSAGSRSKRTRSSQDRSDRRETSAAAGSAAAEQLARSGGLPYLAAGDRPELPSVAFTLNRGRIGPFGPENCRTGRSLPSPRPKRSRKRFGGSTPTCSASCSPQDGEWTRGRGGHRRRHPAKAARRRLRFASQVATCVNRHFVWAPAGGPREQILKLLDQRVQSSRSSIERPAGRRLQPRPVPARRGERGVRAGALAGPDQLLRRRHRPHALLRRSMRRRGHQRHHRDICPCHAAPAQRRPHPDLFP